MGEGGKYYQKMIKGPEYEEWMEKKKFYHTNIKYKNFLEYCHNWFYQFTDLPWEIIDKIE